MSRTFEYRDGDFVVRVEDPNDKPMMAPTPKFTEALRLVAEHLNFKDRSFIFLGERKGYIKVRIVHRRKYPRTSTTVKFKRA